MELTDQLDGATHEVHGVRFIRTGSCSRCGKCGCDTMKCPHYSTEKVKGVVLDKCAIQDTKNEVCEICTKDPESGFYKNGEPVTHKMCADFPDHPWLHVIKEGKCAYSFSTTDAKEETKLIDLNTKFSVN